MYDSPKNQPTGGRQAQAETVLNMRLLNNREVPTPPEYLPAPHDNFALGDALGQGGYGATFMYRAGEETLAAKVCVAVNELNNPAREVQMLGQVQAHENIIRLVADQPLGASGGHVIVMEFVRSGFKLTPASNLRQLCPSASRSLDVHTLTSPT